MQIPEITENIRSEIFKDDIHLSDGELMKFIEKSLLSERSFVDCSPKQINTIANNLFHTLRSSLGVLQPLLDDDNVSEIMVNGYNNLYVERYGYITGEESPLNDNKELEDIIRRIAAGVHREINEMIPILDARLEDGSRVNVVWGNVSIDGPCLTIRKFKKHSLTLKDLVEGESVSEEAANFLSQMVKNKKNIFISGGTSTGKTTFLNALSNEIPKEERIITIEDTAELQIQNHTNLIRLETRQSNTEGKGAVEISDLIKTSLRMRPDRIIVGEVRGKEVSDMINAMNTGHEGSMCTGHANSASGMIKRLSSLLMMSENCDIEFAKEQIMNALDILVHLKRMESGKRKVESIYAVVADENDIAAIVRLFYTNEKRNLASDKAGMELYYHRILRDSNDSGVIL